MKKILDCDDSYVLRSNEDKLGIIFPNACSGHFLYTFYSKDTDHLSESLEIDKFGTAHRQHRNDFDMYADYEDEFQYKDKPIIDASPKTDFLAHYYDFSLTRKLYPEHFLIGVKISPELMLLPVYMMVFKVLQQKRPVAFKNFHLKEKQHQYDRYQNFFNHFSNYRYCDSVDLMYTTKEIMYDKTVNTRLINYRKSNKQYVYDYISYFESFKKYFSSDFKAQFEYEKSFFTNYREDIHI